MTKKAAFSIPSIISIIAAILTFATGAFFGLIWAGVAVVFGLLGVLLSLSPSIRGGFLSILGVLGGLIGVIAAIIKAIAYFLS
ncbi:hypothetical protein JIN85_00475 [Luteolibacter pohnpeiensis]|uniref:Uncharacterized protein n=1 Tax=Luteolibacter pohnpeiensis TaxID=454153 RepID=A0A934VUU4_9BACT|nr:hypothetical protein [Luteolibacter pohnpeiensis]MBK1880864.1 hypothetical protein [Luteolibacter pohnpeiensis]